ncbi:acyl-CoA dehydrogenase family protein [Brevibacillus sp. AY1]|uniref:acyl-CoA dehydrogenase family protein n=1 Tax=Brevibacillus sp. AY1 TaxID=2807621 RepID=UPI002458EBAB|nr:acyl-CoA dehydrogenase family protein [Brevibacillus sp. AY1]MDH4620165.1 acyl-CoA dehydrogenase family protein [Brevibacillus sp. AY1]
MSATTSFDGNKVSKPYYNSEHLMFREALRKFLDKEVVPHLDQWEEDEIVPRSFWDRMGELGFLCPQVSPEYGGLGLDFGFQIVLAEEAGRVGGLGGPGIHTSIVVPYLEEFGTEEQKKKYLPKCISGEIVTAVAMTEPGAGSDLAGIRTTAVRDGDHYIVNGQKTFISNGIHSDLIVVAVKTDTRVTPGHKGISLLLVERGMPGFIRGRKLKKVGLRSQDTAELIFEDCRVPVENLLGQEGKGFYYLMHKLQQERLLAAIGAIVSAEDMLQITMQYVKERQAFGKSISTFQNTQFEIAEMATEVQLGRTFVDDLIVRHMNGENIVTQVSMAKWWITDMARKMAPRCMQLHGGYGFMEEYKIARRYRDIAISPIFAGTNEIMKIIIAKNLGL